MVLDYSRGAPPDAELPAEVAPRGGIGVRNAGVATTMTAPDTVTTNLGRFGLFGMGATPEQAQEIERLGYGAIWVAGSPPAELSFVEPLLESTRSLKVATGIVNIWTAAAKPVAESFHRINTAYPGRFVLGVGVGHPEAQAQYRKPYDALVSYLDELDEYGVPANQRVLAALGPRVLKLSGRGDGRGGGRLPRQSSPRGRLGGYCTGCLGWAGGASPGNQAE